ncbi:hypothetical protein [Psychromicrobium sp. YIM B11713]|uniref:hypothetical protein n=1 Tax=Psychromicrobium sp. YIM B11713 TaxID=3145233 RepID=UPI00374EA61A
MPEVAAWTQRARYEVSLGNGIVKTRYLPQRVGSNKWVSLGVFPIDGVPKVTLSNTAVNGDGVDDVAWDAVSFLPLAQKPRDIVVAIGDSFSSGEGAKDYFSESDNNGNPINGKPNRFQNACHRSNNSWSLKSVLPGSLLSTKNRIAQGDPSIDYSFVACSGAETKNALPFLTVPDSQRPQSSYGAFGTGQYGEVAQLDSGFIDESTTLVTMTMGGNDLKFAQIMQACVGTIMPRCLEEPLEGDAISAFDATNKKIKDNLYFDLLKIMQEIKKKAPSAKILIMGYPFLIERNLQCFPNISSKEIDQMAQIAMNIRAMLLMLKTAGGAQGIDIVLGDPIDKFQNHSVCANENAGINGIVTDQTEGEVPAINVFNHAIPLGLSAQSFHPNQLGTTLYAEVMNEALRK